MSAKGLGRGLSALFGEETDIAAELGSQSSALRISDIEPNPDQPRRHFDAESLQSLAESIRENGLLQPIAVRRSGSGIYQIIAGERRWRAARIAGLREIPVIVLDADDLKAAQLAMIENLQREDLNPIEEALGYQTLIKTFGLTQDEAAGRVGRSRPAVANALRLLSLPEELQSMVTDGRLSAGHARTLLAIPDAALQQKTALTAIAQEMTVRELERYVRRLLAEPKEQAPTPSGQVDYARELGQRLSKTLGRRITLRPGAKKGKLEIEYYGNDDLDILIALLEGAIENE